MRVASFQGVSNIALHMCGLQSLFALPHTSAEAHCVSCHVRTRFIQQHKHWVPTRKTLSAHMEDKMQYYAPARRHMYTHTHTDCPDVKEQGYTHLWPCPPYWSWFPALPVQSVLEWRQRLVLGRRCTGVAAALLFVWGWWQEQAWWAGAGRICSNYKL